MINKLHIYLSDGNNPYENLATEKYLLDITTDDSVILYLWQNQNTVVIGRNQNPWSECKIPLLEKDGTFLARRLSGGGAVFHDLGNLNFTFICSNENYDIQKQMEVIKTACNSIGIPAVISGRNDILVCERKFSGNAFYSAGGKSYHHGTILISSDMKRLQRYLTPPKAKLSAKGVKSVKSRVVNLTEFEPSLTPEIMKEQLILAFGKVYGIEPHFIPPIPYEKISDTASEYSKWEYLYGRKLPFTLSCEKQFPWGNVNLRINAKGGIIEDVELYTDSMDWSLKDTLKSALTGCRFEIKSIKEALISKLPYEIAMDFYLLLESQEI